MNEKTYKKIIHRLEHNKITDDILDKTTKDMPDYWRGYFTCYIDGLSDSLEHDNPDFKWYLVRQIKDCFASMGWS